MGKADIRKILFPIILALVRFGSQAQDIYFNIIQPSNELIDTGIFKDYRRFDLGKIDFYNGRKENNLQYFFTDKSNGKVLYQRPEELSDAMILKPKFFYSDSTETYIILIEEAAEYSWGQDVILILYNEIKFIGFLDYAVDKGNGESV